MNINVALPFSGKQHKKILSEIRQRINAAQAKTKDRVEKWEFQERQAQGFIKLSELEKKTLRQEKQKYVSVQVPYSYGMMMSAHTYFASVFLSRDPVFQVEGRHGEAEMNVQAMEALLRYQLVVGQMQYPLFIWLYDAAKYGLGILGAYWDEKRNYVSQIVEEPKKYLGVEIPGTMQKRRVTTSVLSYAGHNCFNVQPQRFFWDPSVTPAYLQRGEYCGRFYTMAWHEFQQGALEGKYINGDEAQQYFGLSDPESFVSSWLEIPDGFNLSNTKTSKGFGSFTDIFVRLIPKEWGLGSSQYPEIWVFTILHQSLIVQARPTGELSGMFPFFTLEAEIEGYGLYRPGMMEQQQSYNDILTWLFNSHFYNVETALNNQFVYDPMRVHMEDILDPAPGKRIRLKPSAAGTDVKTAVTQLATYDVTQTHMSDFEKVGQLMQRGSGIADGIMGMLAPGGRKSATESRIAAQGAANRLKTLSEYMGAQGWLPFSQYLIANSQQFYQADMKLKIAGSAAGTQSFIQVNPETIAGAYDYIPVDGNMPIDRFAQAQLYQELMLGLAQNPMLAQQFDFVRMATYIAKLFGMKSVDEFRVQTVPNQQLEAEVQAGNAVPLQEAL